MNGRRALVEAKRDEINEIVRVDPDQVWVIVPVEVPALAERRSNLSEQTGDLLVRPGLLDARPARRGVRAGCSVIEALGRRGGRPASSGG